MNEISGRADLSRKVIIGMLVVIMSILVVYMLRVARIVIIPLFFAFFAVMLVYPIQQRLNGLLPNRLHRLRPVLGAILLILITAMALTLCAGTIWLSVKMITDKVPQYSGKFLSYWNRFVTWAHGHELLGDQNVMQSGDVRSAMVKISAAVIRSIGSITAALAMIFFLALLLLLEVCEWRGKFLAAFGEERTAAIFETLYSIAHKLRHFLLIRTMIGAISGIVAGLWLWIIGVDLAFLWGLVTFLFNYVPYVGSILSPIPPSLIALAQRGLGWALLTAGGLAVLDQILGNYVDPRLEGRALIISPTLILLSILFWGWLWGIAGALLAVPITITMIATCSHIQALRPVATLFSRNIDHC
ncbi:AI-2E family transporter [Candidatus Poribacteria bacterium]